MFLPGIAAMLLMPLMLYFLSPLEIKSTPNASTFAKDKLKELVKMKNSEKIMLSVFVSLLLLWAGALGLFFLEFLLMRLVWLCLGCLWC
ncbi:C4-dicarboxylate ABC transporter [Campylobacter jejuni]|nr:C4-dicarboxylate ABC transporter [Campylobacter jejuni]EAH8610138.1 C4-dicarboxylate ABC transporter [Campylobacter jejuni]EAM0578990.1 C4-dicarboxylate ABC transporter [Campylobacter jejuni]EDP4298449.1 C4-dicarboxylate ABC transporter [Campylobacter jejuni]ELN6427590.1 anion permease [Campylobacter jejuni]